MRVVYVVCAGAAMGLALWGLSRLAKSPFEEELDACRSLCAPHEMYGIDGDVCECVDDE